MSTKIYSLSICGQATLDMHSLNNEGGEGNQIQTRMVEIVDENGRLQTVNAISGDMFKHIQTEHLHRLSKGKLPLSKGAEIFNANRISADDEFVARITKGKYKPSQVIDDMVQTCAISDLAGVLITQGNRSVPRKSVAEFGWVVGLPKETVTEQYFHAKYVLESPESSKDKEERTGNLGQNIFYRPASSGIYAIVSHLEIARIGFNDITHTYAIDANQRQLRYQALLESVLYSFIQPNGAMRSTQLPHLVNFSGVVSYSTQPVPAPTISPLKMGNEETPAYITEIKQVAEKINVIRPNAVQVETFDDLTGLTGIMGKLIKEMEPYQI
jgi:CRISPR-associated protein Cst2